MNYKLLGTICALLVLSSIAPIYSTEEVDDTIIILVSDNMADSAMAHMISDELGADVYFTPWGEYDQAIADLIIGTTPSMIYIIGGYSAVPLEYDQAFSEFEFVRIGGDDRSQTSLRLLQYFQKMFQQKNVNIVNGEDEGQIGKALQNAIEKGNVFVYANNPNDISDVSLELDQMGFYWGDLAIEDDGGDEDLQADAEAALATLEDLLSELTIIIPDYPSNPVIVLHTNALEKYEKAQEAYDDGDFGKAFCYATIGISHAEKAFELVEKGTFYKGNLVEKSASQLEDLHERRLQIDSYLALLEEVPEDISTMLNDIDALISEAEECHEAGDYECCLNKIALAKYLMIDICKALDQLLGFDVELDCDIQENAENKLNELISDRADLDDLFSELTEVPEDIANSLNELDALIVAAQDCFDSGDYVCTLEKISEAKSIMKQIEHDIESILGESGNNGNKDNNGKGNDKI